jgi:UDP-N-acetylmuramoyl-tripeptide--D-alanyl-D-alanine ligase
LLNLPISEAAQSMGAEVSGEIGGSFPEVSIDSRTLQPGQSFFAIQGERFDGHEFISSSLEKGAQVIVHSESDASPSEWPDRCFLKVADTTAALQNLGHYIRQLWGGKVVAITGSMGKTTTRHFTSSLLSRRFRVYQSHGNFNNEFGLPLSLLSIKQEDEVAVLELGMSHPGEIDLLSQICQPDIGVLTNVAPVHLEFFESIDDIACAKGELVDHVSEAGALIYNAADTRVALLADQYQGTKVSFGVETKADCSVDGYRLRSLREMTFRLVFDQNQYECEAPFAGVHHLHNIAAASAVAWELGVAPGDIVEEIARLEPYSGRGRIMDFQLPQGGIVTVLDDSYNSSPLAVQAVLETVRKLEGFPRCTLALGEMLELGDSSADLHFEVGKVAARCDPVLLATVGKDAAFILEGARSAGLPDDRLLHFKNSADAAESILPMVRGGDLLICKGSRGVRMDIIIQRLEAGKEELTT